MVDFLINKGYEGRVIDNFSNGFVSNLNLSIKSTKLKIEKLDICKIKLDNKIFKDIDYVIHFAGLGNIVPSIEDPEPYIKTNVLGTVKMLECSKKNNVKKFVYAASSSCYGKAKIPTDENHKIQPEYPYALSKYLGEQSVIHWNKVYSLPIVSLRIFHAFGLRLKTKNVYGGVIGVFLKQKLSNKPLTIIGNGSQKRDFVYVSDVVEAFYKAAKSKIKNGIYNLGSGKPNSINKLADLIEGKKFFLPSRPGEPKITCANISKIKKNLKWSPKISFEKGVYELLENIETWDNAPLWEKHSIKKEQELWMKYLK